MKRTTLLAAGGAAVVAVSLAVAVPAFAQTTPTPEPAPPSSSAPAPAPESAAPDAPAPDGATPDGTPCGPGGAPGEGRGPAQGWGPGEGRGPRGGGPDGAGPGGPPLERHAGEPATVESTVASTTTGPDGGIRGLVLADGTVVRVPPRADVDLAAYPVGTPLRVEGERTTAPDGSSHLHPTTITNTATGESVTVPGR